MRVLVATAISAAAILGLLHPVAARSLHRATPWCVIQNTGRAEWYCWPSRALCHRFGEVPGRSSLYCVPYPLWSGRR